MAVSFVSAGTIAEDLTGAASFTPTPPAHLANDILIAAAWNEGGSKPTTATAGRNEIATGAGTNDATRWRKRATGAGTAGPTITAADTDCFGIVYVIRGCNTGNTPYEDATVSGDGTTADTTPDTATVTTTGSNRLVMAFLANADDISFSSGFPPSGWTSATSDVSSGGGTDAGFQTIGKFVSGGDATSVVIGTWAVGQAYWCLTLCFIPEFTPDQHAFRFYEDGTEAGSTAIDTQDTNITRNLDSDSNLQLRLRVLETIGGSGATSDDYQLQYSKNGGAYTSITGSSTVVKSFPSTNLTDGSATTNRLGTPGFGSFLAGEVEEANGVVEDFQLTQELFTELLYSLTVVSADVANGDTIDFRLLVNGAAMAYTVTPRVTVSKTVTQTGTPGSLLMMGLGV